MLSTAIQNAPNPFYSSTKPLVPAQPFRLDILRPCPKHFLSDRVERYWLICLHLCLCVCDITSGFRREAEGKGEERVMQGGQEEVVDGSEYLTVSSSVLAGLRGEWRM